jgi:hypothetical protein
MVLKYLVYVVCMYLSISVYVKTGQVRYFEFTNQRWLGNNIHVYIYTYVYIYDMIIYIYIWYDDIYIYIYDMIIYVKIGWKWQNDNMGISIIYPLNNWLVIEPLKTSGPSSAFGQAAKLFGGFCASKIRHLNLSHLSTQQRTGWTNYM